MGFLCLFHPTYNWIQGPTLYTGNLISLPSIFGYLIWSEHGLMLCNFSSRPWAISMSIWSATTWRWRWLETWDFLILGMEKLLWSCVLFSMFFCLFVECFRCGWKITTNRHLAKNVFLGGHLWWMKYVFAKKTFLMWIDGVGKRMNHVSLYMSHRQN